MKSRTEVIEMVRAKIRLRHFALSTEATYTAWIARYYDHCLKLDPQLPPEKKAESFLTGLAALEERQITRGLRVFRFFGRAKGVATALARQNFRIRRKNIRFRFSTPLFLHSIE